MQFVHDVQSVEHPFTVNDFASVTVYYFDYVDFGSISSELSYCLARPSWSIVI